MKKGIIAMLIIPMIMLTGCTRGNHRDYSEIYESYGKIEDYTADIQVKISSQDGETSYTATQYYMAPDLYRLDYSGEDMQGISCVLAGENLSFKDKDGNVTSFKGYVPNEKYYIFITDFIERYCKSEEAKSSQKAGDTILEVKGEDKDPNRAAMKLWVDNKTKIPKKLITYNDKGEERITVLFSNFKMNTNIDKKLFDI